MKTSNDDICAEMLPKIYPPKWYVAEAYPEIDSSVRIAEIGYNTNLNRGGGEK
jgi:hypothetical protein